MGVSGLTPFLQKTCPEVIKTLPDRLRQLTGKTVVIDGTLITQRFHFANVPHAYRHVLGWYRLVKELEEYGVRAVCVFDGKERSVAKQNENERRRTIRKLTAARASIETERLQRLRKLNGILSEARIAYKNASASHSDRGSATWADFHADIISEEVSSYTKEPAQATITPGHDVLVRSHSYRPLPYLSRSSNADMELSNAVPGIPTDVALRTAKSNNGHDSFKAKDNDLMRGGTSLPSNTASMTEPAMFHDDENRTTVEDDKIQNTPLEPYEATQGVFISTAVPSGETVRAVQTPHPPNEHIITKAKQIPTSLTVGKEREAAPSVVGRTIITTRHRRVLPSTQPSAHTADKKADGEFFSAMDSSPMPLKSAVDDVQAQVAALEPIASALREQISEDAEYDMYVRDVVGTGTMTPTPTKTATLTSLYADFKRSISQVNTVVTSSSSAPLPGGTHEDVEEARQDATMSRTQAALTLAESRIWEEINGSPLPEVDMLQEHIHNDLAELESKSVSMSASLDRRVNAPTEKTYAECKEILCAMGTPCIESTGAFEAEALASSLVVHGYADYVASEDTDVLVYEAPLLRNITNRKGPLTIVSGSDVRSVLQLDRAGFIDFALLLGTDFTQRIKNVGPSRAYKFIRQHGTIEQVLAQETAYPPRVPARAYLSQIHTARVVFDTLPPVPDPACLEPGERDEERIAEVLGKYGVQTQEYNWEGEATLGSNYFGDKPSTGNTDFAFTPYI